MKRLLVAFFCLGLGLVLLSPLVSPATPFRMPEYSSDFDCDDSALLMLDRLKSIGITGTAILGNLKTTGESYPETDHVWILAEIAGRSIALDGGTIRFDRQHYEGFRISRDELLGFVAQDRGQGQAVVNPSER